jgi:hypothetical protein
MMLELLAGSALRSVVLGGAVWAGLALLRVHRPQLQMTAWTVVLIVSLAMPLLTPWMRITTPADIRPAPMVSITWTAVPQAWTDDTAVSTPVLPADRPGEAPEPAPPTRAVVPAIDWRWVAFFGYAAVGGALLVRLLAGLVLMWQVARAATPVRHAFAATADVRMSDIVVVPVTFASTILLPVTCTEWSPRKLQAALLHEGAHVRNGDFYVLLLAAINRAVFWFNPFAWWLLTRLSDLAEMISDDAAIGGLKDRRSYADILIDVARAAQRPQSGLAMARPGTVGRRVKRILAATAVPTTVRGRTRLLTALVVASLSALSAISFAQSAPPPKVDAAALQTVPVPTTELDRSVGQFQMNVTSVVTVTRDGAQLFAQETGQPKLELFPTAAGGFVTEIGDGVKFTIKGDGPASEILITQPNTGQRRGTRIDEARASDIEATFRRRVAMAPDRFRDQTPFPTGKAALRQSIEDLARGTPRYDGMSPQIADKLRQQLPQLQPIMVSLGAVQSIFFRGVGPGGYDIYGVKFANGSAEFRIDISPDGRIEDVNFRPNGDGTLGGTASCALESTLKATASMAAIRLSLFNRSGGDLRVFWLNAEGRRVAQGGVAHDRSIEVMSYVARPIVVTDTAGQCREIILPGQTTRFHVVEPLGSAEPAGPSTVQRTTPLPGSDEALEHHIDGVRLGTPDYDRMTPAMAAATRQQLPQQQAILAKLGDVRSISFRGVSPAGRDIYLVQFANGSAEWQIGMLPEGRIGAIALGPQY